MTFDPVTWPSLGMLQRWRTEEVYRGSFAVEGRIAPKPIRALTCPRVCWYFGAFSRDRLSAVCTRPANLGQKDSGGLR